MVCHWSLSDSKSPQVFRTLLSNRAVLNDAVVWMVSTRPLISKSFSPFNNLLATVPKTPITINVTSMFHSFFFPVPQQGQGIYPSFHFLSILLHGQSRQQSPQFCRFSFLFLFRFFFFFLLIIIRSVVI